MCASRHEVTALPPENRCAIYVLIPKPRAHRGSKFPEKETSNARETIGGSCCLLPRSCVLRRNAGLPGAHGRRPRRGRRRGHRRHCRRSRDGCDRRRRGRRADRRGHVAPQHQRSFALLLSERGSAQGKGLGATGAGPFRFCVPNDIGGLMSGRAGMVRLWALLSAGWMLGLNLLLGFVILKYRSVLWGWLDLSNAIDWPKLIG